ncbi:hypothetical protein [Chitinasiproducens palmae]|uniref:Uncharacterized protein n=1 Tax=Chitinasiproducens palmae TaxID=1770053 RepID=A0A1H2PRQ7_9BURK|nr:hypothetical protein [Chitinasiproducens palmae]SDV49165.1 hypothetical protein SAMN05216551_107119 [Chitinasiproducens palmae]
MSDNRIQGFTFYTAGDSNSITKGNQTTATAGTSNTFAVGGSTAYSGLLNGTVVLGTYLEAVRGNTIEWTNGPSLSMTDGDSFSSNTTSRQQASKSYEIAAGISTKDEPAWDLIKDSMALMKKLIALQAGLNAAVSAADMATGYEPDKVARIAGVAQAASIGVANGAFAIRLAMLATKIAKAAETLDHVGSVKVDTNGVEVDGTFPSSVGALNIIEESVTLSRAPVVANLYPKSTLAFTNGGTALQVGSKSTGSQHVLSERSQSLMSSSRNVEFGAINVAPTSVSASVTNSMKASSTLTLTPKAAALSAGPVATAGTIQAADGQVSLTVAMTQLQLTSEAFKVKCTEAGGTVQVNGTGVTADGVLIKLG